VQLATALKIVSAVNTVLKMVANVGFVIKKYNDGKIFKFKW
jgi:hypothetical protein